MDMSEATITVTSVKGHTNKLNEISLDGKIIGHVLFHKGQFAPSVAVLDECGNVLLTERNESAAITRLVERNAARWS